MSEEEVINIKNLNELTDIINYNIYEFRKIVHKLEQRYKSNKINIDLIKGDIKNINTNIDSEIINIKNTINDNITKFDNEIININNNINIEKDIENLNYKINMIAKSNIDNQLEILNLNDNFQKYKLDVKYAFMIYNLLPLVLFFTYIFI